MQGLPGLVGSHSLLGAKRALGAMLMMFREPAMKQMLYKGAGSGELNVRQAEAADAMFVGLPTRLDAVINEGHQTS